jgi:hypothetical protein
MHVLMISRLVLCSTLLAQLDRGGNRQLELVETDSATSQNDPAYRQTSATATCSSRPSMPAIADLAHSEKSALVSCGRGTTEERLTR